MKFIGVVQYLQENINVNSVWFRNKVEMTFAGQTFKPTLRPNIEDSKQTNKAKQWVYLIFAEQSF